MASQLLSLLRERGLTVTARGGSLAISPRVLLTDELRAAIQAHKAAILAELAANDADVEPAVEARRRRVLELLDRHPDWRYAVVVETAAEAGLVVVHVAVRGLASGELLIDKARYDPVELTRCMDRAAEAQRASAKAILDVP